MDRYRRMAVLAAVVESGSLRRAARELGLTPSAVSQQIRRLEEEVGALLLRRSTRRLDLTEAGDAFYQGCAAMVEAARTAQERLAAVLEAPTGELSLGVPAGFAADHLVPALAPLLESHSGLRLRLLVTDEKIDLVQERLDLAVTIGRSLPSSSLVRHHLADWDLGLYASPAYLARRGTPAEPRALAPGRGAGVLRLGASTTVSDKQESARPCGQGRSLVFQRFRRRACPAHVQELKEGERQEADHAQA